MDDNLFNNTKTMPFWDTLWKFTPQWMIFWWLKWSIENTLQQLGINKDEIDKKVEQEIKTVSETDTMDEYINSLTETETDTAIDDYINSLSLWVTPTEEITEPVEQKTAIWEFLPKVWEASLDFLWWIKNVFTSSVAQTPEMAWNLTGFILWKPIDFTLEKLWYKDFATLEEHLKSEWKNQKQTAQEILWVDDDTWTNTVWEVWIEIASLFVPWSAATKADKIQKTAVLTKQFPKVANWIKKISTKVDKLAKEAPKTFTALKEALLWAREAAKFGVVSEWDISPTWVTIWAVANPVLSSVWRVIKWVVNWDAAKNFIKSINPKKKVWVTPWKQSQTVIDDTDIILWRIKADWAKPSTMVELHKYITKKMNEVYTKHINPALEQAKTKTISLANSVDDAYNTTIWKWEALWADTAKLVWKKSQIKALDDLVTEWRKLWDDITPAAAEEMKRLLAVANRQIRKWWVDKVDDLTADFIQNLNKSIQKNLDDVLEEVLWKKWLTALKREYAAYSNRLTDIDDRIFVEQRKAWTNLFEGLWIISWLRDMVEWLATASPSQVWGWITSILTWKLLRIFKDPDEILQKAMRQLYKTDKWISERVIWAWAEELWEQLDIRANQ